MSNASMPLETSCDPEPLRLARLILYGADVDKYQAPPAAFKLLESTAARDLGLSDQPDFAEFLAQLPAELEETMSSL